MSLNCVHNVILKVFYKHLLLCEFSNKANIIISVVCIRLIMMSAKQIFNFVNTFLIRNIFIDCIPVIMPNANIRRGITTGLPVKKYTR